MPVRLLKILALDTQKGSLQKLAEEPGVIECWSHSESGNNKKEFSFLILSEHLQSLTDKIQSILGPDNGWRIIITHVETTIPRYQADEDDEPESRKLVNGGRLTREALYDQILKGTMLSTDFYILVFLSTLVTAIGLITSNIAVIIGAMVIAPLLGPHLALSFGVTLGEREMIREALRASALGFGFTMLISLLAGFLIPPEHFNASPEFLQRTDVGFGGIVLALASGAAAVLSLTSGVSSTMVGVMVAVALMPPAVAMGLAFGSGMFAYGYGAALLLAINVTCVNLAAQMIFILKGIKPRTWYQRRKSSQSVRASLSFWTVWLLILVAVIYLWHYR